MRFLFCFLSLCHTLWPQHSKIILFLHTADPKQDHKSVLFEFHFPGLVLLVARCNWALVLEVLFRGVVKETFQLGDVLAQLPQGGCTRDVVAPAADGEGGMC